MIRIYIPTSITYKSKKYTVVNISKYAFKYSASVYIFFHDESEIKEIPKKVFSDSKIKRVVFPAHTNRICKCAFLNCGKLQQIEFPQNSELRTIEKEAFRNSSIENLMIPAKLIDLKEGWCKDADDLIKICVDEKNPRYSFYDEKFLIGKSDLSSDNYDILEFASRDIYEAIIPPFIKVIKPYAFGNCTKLNRIEIPPNSELRTIEKKAFSFTNIKSFSIPASLVELKDNWCNDIADHSIKIEVDPRNPRYSCQDGKIIYGKSNLSSDDYDILVFLTDDFDELTIPPSIRSIAPCAFEKCEKLSKINFPQNTILQTIGSYSFTCTSIMDILIPPSVTQICKRAFDGCYKLVRIEFSPNSELRIIEKNAFSFIPIERITIPPSVIQICENAFANCYKLVQIEFGENSELRIIEKEAFSDTSIKNLTIPANLIDLKDGWCKNASKLVSIQVDKRNPRYTFFDGKFLIGKQDLSSQNYDTLLFCARNIVEPIIPPFIKTIGPYAFQNCGHLTHVNFSQNSELQTICEYAFHCALIKSISIHPHIKQIYKRAFYMCMKLKYLEIPPNSELQTIGKETFGDTHLKSVSILPHMVPNCFDALSTCYRIQIIELDGTLENQFIDISSLHRNAIIMVPVQSVHNIDTEISNISTDSEK